MIYLFTDYDLITKEYEELLLEKLPPVRKEKALRFKPRDGRISCIVGYLLFLYGYKKLYHYSDTPDFSKGDNDKPFLLALPHINFNISHCKGAATCIFSEKPVGIDIQELRLGKLSAMLKICSEDEQALIESAADPDMEFCKIWSIKEAISKQSGDGIFRDIKNLSSEGLFVHTELIDNDKFLTAAGFFESEFSINKLSLSQLLEL